MEADVYPMEAFQTRTSISCCVNDPAFSLIFLNMKYSNCNNIISTFAILLLLLQISLATKGSSKKDDSSMSQHPWINRTTPNLYRSLRDWVWNEEYRRSNIVSDYYSPLASCGDGKCDEGETVFNCPQDCKSYPEME